DLALIVFAPLCQRLFEPLNSLEVHASVLVCMTEVEPGSNVRQDKVRTRRIAGLVQSSPMEGGRCRDQQLPHCCRSQRHRSAKAIPYNAHPAWPYGGLCVQKVDIGSNVPLLRLCCKRCHEFGHALHRARLSGHAGKIEDRGTARSVERIHQKHGITIMGEAPSHAAMRLANASDV